MAKRHHHAIVIGGSMAGLMAARVLANHFDQVTILERDHLPAEPQERKGVPQGRHAHSLLIRGRQALERFFPGFTADLVEGGAVETDSGSGSLWYHHGVIKGRAQTDLPVFFMSRALLEFTARRRLLMVPNVRIREGVSVTRLLTADGHARVTGIVLQPVGGEAEELAADLVVDATGRGTRTPGWLQEMGYPGVAVEQVKVDMVYASRIVKAPANPPDWAYMIQASDPPYLRGAALFPLEGGRWLVTLQGYFGDAAPEDDAGFLAFARSMPLPDLYDRIKDLEPLTPVASFRIPSSMRRRYDRLPRFPDGLIALGDSVCSFNPIYGQGITTAALCCERLDEMLQAAPSLNSFSLAYQKAMIQVTEGPWQAATGEDLRFPKTEGKRTPATRFINWYTRRMTQLTATHPDVLKDLCQVIHMVAQPTILFKPKYLWLALTEKPPTTA